MKSKTKMKIKTKLKLKPKTKSNSTVPEQIWSTGNFSEMTLLSSAFSDSISSWET